MSGFKYTPNGDDLLLEQRGGKVVYLEAEDDYQIIAERWFFDYSREHPKGSKGQDKGQGQII